MIGEFALVEYTFGIKEGSDGLTLDDMKNLFGNEPGDAKIVTEYFGQNSNGQTTLDGIIDFDQMLCIHQTKNEVLNPSTYRNTLLVALHGKGMEAIICRYLAKDTSGITSGEVSFMIDSGMNCIVSFLNFPVDLTTVGGTLSNEDYVEEGDSSFDLLRKQFESGKSLSKKIKHTSSTAIYSMID